LRKGKKRKVDEGKKGGGKEEVRPSAGGKKERSLLPGKKKKQKKKGKNRSMGKKKKKKVQPLPGKGERGGRSRGNAFRQQRKEKGPALQREGGEGRKKVSVKKKGEGREKATGRPPG